MELCSSCAKRDALPDVGFCLECTRARVAEKYAEEDTKRALLRTKRWRARSGQGRTHTAEDREHDRLRQQRHRDLEKIRPRDRAPDGIDPAVIAREGLYHLSQVRALAKNKHQHEHLEVVAEAIKRLAWGPED